MLDLKILASKLVYVNPNICHAISRVLSLTFYNKRLTIYLVLLLPTRSSGSYDSRTAGTLMFASLLAAGRVYLCVQSPARTVGSYPTLFTIASPFGFSCVVSVALSLKLLPVAVSNCLTLCRPDFPLVLLRIPAVSCVADNYIIAYFVLLGHLGLY